jgi:GAF domain-containing protein
LIQRADSQSYPLAVDEGGVLHHLSNVVCDPMYSSALIAPIPTHMQPLGILLAVRAASDPFLGFEIELLQTLLNQVAIALSTAVQAEIESVRMHENSLLHGLTRTLSESENLTSVLEVARSYVHDFLLVDDVVIFLYDPQSEHLIPTGIHKESVTDFDTYRVQADDGIPGFIYTSLMSFNEPDIGSSLVNSAAPLPAGVSSVLGVPLSARVDNGVLLAMSKHRRLFSTKELQVMETVGRQIAFAIENVVLKQKLQDKATTTRRYFIHMAKTLGQKPNDSLAEDLLELLLDMMEADCCAIHLYREAELVCVGHQRCKSPFLSDPSFHNLLTGAVASQGRALAVASVEGHIQQNRSPSAQREDASYLGIPLKSERRTIGVLEIFSRPLRQFKQPEIKILKDYVRHTHLAELVVQWNG